MSSTYNFTAPPLASEKNKRLLPNILEDLAREKPNAPWAEVPISATDYSAGYRPITWAALSNAVNGLAWHLESQIGRSTTFETVAYMGPSDARYVIIMVACIKLGYKVLLTSPRNSLAAHSNLFDKLECNTMITTAPQPPFVRPILKARGDMKLLQIPSLDELLTKAYEKYPYRKTFESARHEKIFCLHTSGSTGLPKPLVYTHEFLTKSANIAQLTPPDGYESVNTWLSNNRFVLLMPLFHIAGLYFGTIMPFFNGNTAILPSPAAPPTGASLKSILENVAADWAFVAPVHAEEVGKNDTLGDFVSSKMKLLVYSGGSVPKAAGDNLASKLTLKSFLGSSEFGGYPHIVPKDKDTTFDWDCIELHPYANGSFEFRNNGYSELVIKRRSNLEPWQALFTLFPEIDEYSTRDLFLPREGRLSGWVHQGRDDDIIVFVTGEKTNPVTFEAAVSKHADISSALVFGAQRFEAGMLIELTPDSQSRLTEADESKVIDSVWPIIKDANAVTPAHARISRTHIIFTSTKKPMSRSAKGTVQRQLTLKLYEQEIDELYKSMDLQNVSIHTKVKQTRHVRSGSLTPPNEASVSVSNIIFKALKEVSPKLELSENDDFFNAGLDSLQVLRLARQLKVSFNAAPVDPGFIYANPSIKQLATALQSASLGQSQTHSNSSSLSGVGVKETFQKHSNYLEILAGCMSSDHDAASSRKARSRSPRVVLLTGSTGSVGSYLLKALINSPSIAHVFCLNRSADSQALQVLRNRERDSALPTVFSAEKVTFLQADLSDVTTLGIPTATYQSMLSSVSLIIHNAWSVDFIQKLSSFTKQLAGVSNLSIFAARAACKPALVFLSSISAVMNLKDTQSQVSENPLETMNTASDGYGESKLIAEKLLQVASQSLNIDTSVIRVGQVAGARKSEGGWNTSEWIPRIVKTSKHIGMLPESLGSFGDRVEWLPIDDLANVLVEVGLCAGQGVSDATTKTGVHEIYHAVNPNRVSWAALRDSAAKALTGDKPVKIVSAEEWLATLRESAAELRNQKHQDETSIYSRFENAVKENPALFLEGFLERTFSDQNPLVMETTNTRRVSETLGKIEPISKEDMSRWAKGIASASV